MVITSIKNFKKDFLINDEYKMNKMFYIDLLPYINKNIEDKYIKAIDEAYYIIKQYEKKLIKRDLSYKEFENLLSISSYNKKIIIDLLLDQGFLNDDDFIKEHVYKFKGKRAFDEFLIRHKIYKKNYEFEEDLDYANDLIDKYINANNYSNKMLEYKINIALNNKGYSYELISNLLKDIKYPDETIPLQKDFNKLKLSVDENKIISKLISKGYKYENIKKVVGDNQ